MKYFYLDGLVKKGPFSKQEIIDLKLSDDSLVFSDTLQKWVQYKELDDFKSKEIKDNVQINRKNRKLSFSTILIFLVFSILGAGIAYYVTNEHKNKDYQKLENMVDLVFDGKDNIRDYKRTRVKGQLSNNYVHPSEYGINSGDDENGSKLIREYYLCESGGWSVYNLMKLNNGYDLIESYSLDMAFKVPESEYYPGSNYGYGTTSGYYIPTNRGTVQNAYDEAMNLISVEKEDESYVASAYNRIITFHELHTALHYIDNVKPTKLTNASVNSKSWRSYGKSSIFNDYWIVWYKQEGKHYEIVLNSKAYEEKLLINIGIGIFIAILISILWIYTFGK